MLVRDRAEAYILAGRHAAPQAVQVADRFHLARNVSDALKELLRSRRWTMPVQESQLALQPETCHVAADSERRKQSQSRHQGKRPSGKRYSNGKEVASTSGPSPGTWGSAGGPCASIWRPTPLQHTAKGLPAAPS
jgi:transposase